MEIFSYRPPEGGTNFGDELNRWLWPQLIPSLDTRAPDTFMFAIGTVLNRDLEHLTEGHRRTIVFGSGYGYGDPPVGIDSWTVRFVRGPITAERVGAHHITDPGALIASVRPRPNGGRSIGYMPHFRWGQVDAWIEAARGTPLRIIDPRWPVDRILDEMGGTRLLLTEAMHGAIAADAWRIPWIPVISSARVNTLKWRDWCGSMELEYEPIVLKALWTRVPERLDTTRHFVLKHVLTGAAVRELTRVAESERGTLSAGAVFTSRARDLEEQVRWLESEV